MKVQVAKEIICFCITEAVLQCQARSRIEERLEVTLTGAIPSSSSGHDLVKLRAVTPINEKRVGSANNGVVVEGLKFQYAFFIIFIFYQNQDQRSLLI